MDQNNLTQGHKIVLFIAYVAAIYLCQVASGLFQEKIYKIPYQSNLPGGGLDIFSDNITPYSFTSGIACLIGYLMLKEQQISFNVPIQKLMKIAVSDLIIHICLITALLRTDYTTLVVVNSCSILSVVVVGAFFSGVKENPPSNQQREDLALTQDQSRKIESQKIGSEKIWICSVVVIGIIVFSYFSPQKEGENKQIAAGGALLTVILFAVAISLQGFRPDFAAQVKQQFHPSPLFLYFSISGILFILALCLSILTWKISYFISFILHHDQLLIDLTCYALLSSIGSLFVYKLISIFRQHIYPLVSGTRKCLTVCVNVSWYGHHLMRMQWLGIFIVFAGVMIEIISNYNLARKILPNDNIRNRQGKNYNKIKVKQQPWSGKRYDIREIEEDVEGI